VLATCDVLSGAIALADSERELFFSFLVSLTHPLFCLIVQLHHAKPPAFWAWGGSKMWILDECLADLRGTYVKGYLQGYEARQGHLSLNPMER
jgi:hypothetical protein